MTSADRRSELEKMRFRWAGRSRKIIFLLILAVHCASPATKTFVTETERKVKEKTFNYIPSHTDIDVKFEADKNHLVGKLFLKEKTVFTVSKKEIKDFDYDQDGNFKNDFWVKNLAAVSLLFVFICRM